MQKEKGEKEKKKKQIYRSMNGLCVHNILGHDGNRHHHQHHHQRVVVVVAVIIHDDDDDVVCLACSFLLFLF